MCRSAARPPGASLLQLAGGPPCSGRRRGCCTAGVPQRARLAQPPHGRGQAAGGPESRRPAGVANHVCKVVPTCCCVLCLVVQGPRERNTSAWQTIPHTSYYIVPYYFMQAAAGCRPACWCSGACSGGPAGLRAGRAGARGWACSADWVAAGAVLRTPPTHPPLMRAAQLACGPSLPEPPVTSLLHELIGAIIGHHADHAMATPAVPVSSGHMPALRKGPTTMPTHYYCGSSHAPWRAATRGSRCSWRRALQAAPPRLPPLPTPTPPPRPLRGRISNPMVHAHG